MNRPAGVSALLALGVLLALLASALALRIPPADPLQPDPTGAGPSQQVGDPPTRAAPAGPQGASAPASAEPAPRTEAATAATIATTTPSTTIVVLRWSAERVELVRAVDKPGLPFAGEPTTTGPARWVLEDPASGARLGEGACAAPRLCDCERGADHRRGDVLVRHEAVVRLKLPRLLPRQRLRLEAPGPAGWETLGAFLVEDRS